MKRFFALSLMILCFQLSNPAFSQVFDGNSWYRLSTQWQGQGKSLSLVRSGQNNLAQLTNSANASEQQWRIVSQGSGWYKIINRTLGDQYCLDVINDGTNRSLWLVQSGSYSGQFWKIERINNEYFRITNQWQSESRSIDIVNDGTNNQIQLGDTGPYAGQMWMISAEAGTTNLNPVINPIDKSVEKLMSSYTKCADENGSYYFSETVDVAYGADGKFVYKNGITGQVNFQNADFGDPIPGVAKAGYYRKSTAIVNKPVVPVVNPVVNPVINPVVNPVINTTELEDVYVDPDEGSYIALSPQDLNSVMRWIAENTKDAKTEYCYKQSYGRGVGVPLSGCPPGTEKNGLLCYPQCSFGYTGVGPVCWQQCPDGFGEAGFSCSKPGTYGRGAGRVPDVSCPPGTPNKQGVGAAAWCDNGPTWPWDLKTAKAIIKCRSDEEMNGGLCYPKCKPGFEASGCCLCTAICPADMFGDIGAFCTKKSYGRGVGTPMNCAGGLEADAGLCYTPCRPGYNGVGPVCWQKCPSTQSVDCAAGCATSTSVCAEKTANMVVSVVMLAVNIFTLGRSSSLSLAKTQLSAALKARNFVKARAAFGRCVAAYAEAFENLTTRQIANTLKQRLSQNAAKFVVKEYAKVHIKMVMQEEFSLDDLRDLAALDPTGVAQVVEAFAQSICPSERPFPVLSRGY